MREQRRLTGYLLSSYTRRGARTVELVGDRTRSSIMDAFIPPTFPLGGGWDDPKLRASDEHILIVRVPRAKGSSQLSPSHFLKISLGSVILPIGTATNSHPLAPNSFSLVCIF